MGVHAANQCCSCGEVAPSTVRITPPKEETQLTPDEVARLGFLAFRMRRLKDGGS